MRYIGYILEDIIDKCEELCISNYFASLIAGLAGIMFGTIISVIILTLVEQMGDPNNIFLKDAPSFILALNSVGFCTGVFISARHEDRT